ncbi:MAG: glycosyltransferase [Verrucomicrobiales bacterium]
MPILFWILTFGLVFFLFHTWINLLVFPRIRLKKKSGPDTPRISVLIPARNEASRIGSCLRSLLAQNYDNFEILVLDDNSEDNTSAVVQEFGFSDEPGHRLRLLRGQALPPAWSGKAWACHQLFLEAQGEYLLFTDADTLHSPSALQACLQRAQSQRIGLLSLWPKQTTCTWSEVLVVPLMHMLILTFLPQWLVRCLAANPGLASRLSPEQLGSLGSANGQFMFFHRPTYEAIGGHQTVKSHMVEDIALGRLVASRMGEGHRLLNADGTALVACRMYENWGQVWEGFSKNLRPAFDRKLGVFLGFGVLQFIFFVLPFLLLPWAFFNSVLWLIPALLVWLLRASLALRFGTPWLSVLGHCLGHLLALMIALNSWRLTASGKLRWKDRVYNSDTGDP